MKFELAIVSILLVGALALPVPEEDVSVVKPVNEVKSEVVHGEDGKHVHHVVKNELRSAVEGDSQYQGKAGEQVKTGSLSAAATAVNTVNAAGVASSANVVNAVAPEVQAPAQVLAEQKEKKTDSRKEEPQRKAVVADAQSQAEHNKVDQTDKQTRSDGVVVDGAKNVPVAGVHVSALGEQKQFVDEVKPSVQENHVEGKSTLPVGSVGAAQGQESTKTELPAQSQVKPELKPDSVAQAASVTSSAAAAAPVAFGAGTAAASAAAAAASVEEKREEVPARQERVAEEKHQQESVQSAAPVAPATSFVVVPTGAPSEVYTEVKSLVAEEPKAQESKPEVQTVTAEGKSLTAVKQKNEKHVHEHKDVKQEHDSVQAGQPGVSSPAKKYENTHEAASHVGVPVEKVGTTAEHKYEHHSLKKVNDSSATSEDKSVELKKTEASKESKESSEESAESSEQKKHN